MMMGNSAETMTLTFHFAGMPVEHSVVLGLTGGGREIQQPQTGGKYTVFI